MREPTHATLMTNALPAEDRALAESLAVELGRKVFLLNSAETPENAVLNDLANRAWQQPQLIHHADLHDREIMSSDDKPSGDKKSLTALVISNHSVAIWESPADQREQLGRHALTFLRNHGLLREVSQLAEEVESLATQVIQDFEEMSLVRSLSSNIDLPVGGESIDDFVLETLIPLSMGVRAEAIVAVMTNGKNDDTRAPIWTDQIGIDDESITMLVQQFKGDVASQPVVKNDMASRKSIAIDGLRHFAMVGCVSKGNCHGWIIACNRADDESIHTPWAQEGFTTVQTSLMETAANQLAAQLHNVRLLKQKEELFTDVVRALVNAVEARDPYTCGHSERVASFAKCLAKHADFCEADRERIYLTGLLHDVGKIAVPDGVLQKPARLTDDERAIIETHTDAGWRILHELEALRDVLPGVLYHHEQYNGNGYPDQLVGENIPIDGRILAVCDAFDAMTSDRPYRKGMSIERALEILQGGAGEYWDPTLIDLFTANLDEINEIRLEHKPREIPARPAPVDGTPIIGHGQTYEL